MYTDTVDDEALVTHTAELYALTHMYQVNGLHVLCENHMITHLTLQLSELHMSAILTSSLPCTRFSWSILCSYHMYSSTAQVRQASVTTSATAAQRRRTRRTTYWQKSPVPLSLLVSVCDEKRFESRLLRTHVLVATTYSKEANIDSLLAYYQSSLRLTFDIENTVHETPPARISPIHLQTVYADQHPVPPSVVDDLARLFADDASKDVSLTVDGEVVARAHKSVLSIRSPVFRTMFAAPMAESRTGEVRMQDASANSVRCFVQFMYTSSLGGAASLDNVRALDLFFMARMYQVLGLEMLCENCMIQHLVTENVLETLRVAELHGCDRVRSAVLNYISAHHQVLVQNAHFQRSCTSTGVRWVQQRVVTPKQPHPLL